MRPCDTASSLTQAPFHAPPYVVADLDLVENNGIPHGQAPGLLEQPAVLAWKSSDGDMRRGLGRRRQKS